MGPRKHRPRAYPFSAAPARSAEQAFWMYGRHPVLAALRNRSAAFAGSGNSRDSDGDGGGNRHSARPRPTVEIVDRRVIASFVPTTPCTRASQALLIRRRYDLGLAITQAQETAGAIFIALDHVTDPRNVGAVLRSAHALRLAVVLQDRHAPEERSTGESGLGRPGSRAVDPRHQSSTHLRALQEAEFRCIGFAGERLCWSWLRCRCKAIWRSYSAPKARG